MLTCKDAAQMLSQRQDRNLSFAERLGLRLHLLMCRGCRSVEQQLDFLSTATAAWRKEHTHPTIHYEDKP